jgi:PAS domain S-box-containing protein
MEYGDKSKDKLIIMLKELHRKYNLLKALLNIGESDNKLIETSLAPDEVKYRSIFNAVTESIIIHNIYTGKIVNVNNAMLKTYGYKTKEEVFNRSIGDLSANIKPYDDEAAQIYIRKAINEGPQTFDWIARKKDGTQFWIEIKLIKTDIEEKGCIVAVGREITERKQIEYAFQRSEKRLLAAQSCAQIGSWEHDHLASIDFWSDEMYKILGFDPALGTPTFSDFLEIVHPEDRERVGNNLAQAIEERKTFGEEYRIIRSDGSLRWMAGRGEPLYDLNRNMIQYVGTVQDITDRKIIEISLSEKSNEIEAQNEEYKQLNEELYRAKEKAEESDRLKTAFLHNISHEIRTPMNAIVGFSGFLNDPDLLPEKREYFIEVIIQSSNQLLSIISDIVNIATIEAGQANINEIEINLNAIIKLLYDQFILKAQKQNILFNYEIVFQDNEANILTDGTKLTEILSNLIGNALKFTKKGYINFGYSLVEELNATSLQFYVEDSGIGIPPKMHEDIFKRFRQVESTATRRYGGSGLGLSISKAYVELLGGKIWVNSQLEKGSTFYFTIPFKRATKKTILEKQPELEIKINQPQTLLIAEDEESNFMLLEEFLLGLNLNIIRAIDGSEAVEICKSNKKVDLVLMDIKMPVMDGYEATKRIRNFMPALPIIAQTAYTTDADRNKALACGCNDFISKPLNQDMLISKIKEQLYKE